VPEDFLIARNPEPGSTLPYLIRVPLGPGPAPAGDRRRLPRAPRGREPFGRWRGRPGDDPGRRRR